MASFEYQALTPEGKRQKGFIEADSDRLARQALREDGLYPVWVEHAVGHKTKKAIFRWQRPIPSQQVALFSRQLATLVDAGIPVEEALHATAQQTRYRRLRKTILSVRSRVREGHTLADGLSEHPHVFSNIFLALVLAGERSGDLGSVLNRLAEYLEESQKLRSTILQGLIYPIVLTTVAIGVVAILMSFVVPKVIAQFDHVHQQLPLLTQLLIKTSAVIESYGLFALLALLVLLIVGHLLLKSPSHKATWHRLILKLPAVSGMVTTINAARMLRTLHILSSSGVPLLDALRTSGNTITNLHLRQAIDASAKQVQAGSALNSAMSEQKALPPIAVYMIASGEKSGELDRMLDKAANMQEQQLERTFRMFLALFEPALIIILGGIVLIIVLAILLPILQLNNLGPL